MVDVEHESSPSRSFRHSIDGDRKIQQYDVVIVLIVLIAIAVSSNGGYLSILIVSLCAWVCVHDDLTRARCTTGMITGEVHNTTVVRKIGLGSMYVLCVKIRCHKRSRVRVAFVSKWDA